MTVLSGVVLHRSFVHGVALCCEAGGGMNGRNGDAVFVVLVVAVVVVKHDTEDESLLEAPTDDTWPLLKPFPLLLLKLLPFIDAAC